MQRLLNHLENELYCRIAPSKIKGAGVGVIAIRDIPKGVNPFKIAGKDCIAYETIKVPIEDIRQLNSGVRKLIKDFIVPGKDFYELPKLGMNNLDIGFYMNHSNNPNMELWYTKKCPYTLFKTSRQIKKGEELTFNYSLL